MAKRPRNIVNDMIDAVETGTARWTRQKKSEERHPGLVRYRVSRLTKESRVTQKAAAWEVMEAAYMAASAGGRLPASARQIYYQARPKIMAATDEKALDYNYFSQTLLPNYIEEHSVGWDVVYDARGHLIEPHSNRRIGCGTIEIDNYLAALKAPEAKPADFEGAYIDVIGPRGGFASVLFCEKEGFNPLFKAVNLVDRFDLMIISNKGVSVTAARLLVDSVCGDHDLPLFVLHDFDVSSSSERSSAIQSAINFQTPSRWSISGCGLPTSKVWSESLQQRPEQVRTCCALSLLRMAQRMRRSPSCSTSASSLTP